MRYNSPDNKPISVNIELARERYITGCRLNVPEGEIKDFSVIVSPQKIGKKKNKSAPCHQRRWHTEQKLGKRVMGQWIYRSERTKRQVYPNKNHSCIRTNNTFERIQFHIRRLTKYKS